MVEHHGYVDRRRTKGRRRTHGAQGDRRVPGEPARGPDATFGDAVLDNSNNLWTGWIIQTAALVFAAQFTIWYQQVIDARTAEPGENGREPSHAELFQSMSIWVIITGVLSLVFDGGPGWLGVGLIVIGVLLTHQLERTVDAQHRLAAGAP